MTYRKRGTVSRWENGTLVRVEERGVAREENGVFTCEPDPRFLPLPGAGERVGERGGSRDALDHEPAHLPHVAAAIADAAGAARVERLLLLDGRSEHEYAERRWSDRTQRVHAALTHARLRAFVDLGSLDLEHVRAHVRAVAEAFARIDNTRQEAPQHVRLAPPVSAAVLPFLLPLRREDVRIVQSAGGVDGYGEAVAELDASGSRRGEWPNAWRPSYRVAPVRVPLNLRIDETRAPIDWTLPRAVAILAPVDGTTFRVLLDDGMKAWPATVAVERIDAVAASTEWYPYAAGSFGAEMML